MAGRWPDFLIVGATKGGTTSLYRYLGEHPGIHMPEEKEPNFFSLTLDEVVADGVETAEARYRELFAEAGDRVTGEASTTYITHPEAPGRIRDRVPDARIVGSLRDPIQRAYSHYWMHLTAGKEKRSFHEVVAAELEGRDDDLFYVEWSRYAANVRRFLDLFGREATLFFPTAELGEDTRGVVRRVVDHVGADPEPVAEIPLERHNRFNGIPYGGLVERVRTSDLLGAVAGVVLPKRVRDYLGNDLLLRDAEERPPIEDRTLEMLADALEGEVAELEELLDRDLPELRASFP